MEGELGQISLQNHLLSLNIKTMRQNVGVKDREVGDVTVIRATIHTEIKSFMYFPKPGGKMQREAAREEHHAQTDQRRHLQDFRIVSRRQRAEGIW